MKANHGQDTESCAPLNIVLLNQSWFAPELKALGQNVITAGWVHQYFDIRFPRLSRWEEIAAMLPEDFRPDVVVYFDDSHSINVRGLEHLEYPCVLHSVDSHHHLSWHSGMSCFFERTLVSQRDYVDKFLDFRKQALAGNYRQSAAERRVRWFPLWAPRETAPLPQRPIDVCFRGNLDAKLHPERASFFAELSRHVHVDCRSGPYHEAYPRSKIVINQAVKGDLNFRVFEAGMAGALLITPRIENGLCELFTPGSDLILYDSGNAKQAAELIRYYLAHDQERIEIAARLREKVVGHHTALARARELLEILREASAVGSPREHLPLRFFGAAVTYLNSAANFAKLEGTGGAHVNMKTFTALAAECLLQCARCEDVCENHREPLTAIIRTMYARCGDQAEALDFAREMWRTRPDSLMGLINYLDELVKQQRQQEALTLASTISDKPHELLTGLTPILEKARETLSSLG